MSTLPSISSQLGLDKIGKHCSQFGLPEREDVIVAKVIRQVSSALRRAAKIGRRFVSQHCYF